jgi:hypothetical protein
MSDAFFVRSLAAVSKAHTGSLLRRDDQCLLFDQIMMRHKEAVGFPLSASNARYLGPGIFSLDNTLRMTVQFKDCLPKNGH